MGERRINPLMILFAVIGALAGTYIGNLVFEILLLKIPTPLVIGLYFGILALTIGVMCLLAEMILPILNGIGWKTKYVSLSWKYLILFTFVLLFAVSSIFQLFYQFDFGDSKRVRDIMLIIDRSSSMSTTDPNNTRLEAAKKLVNEMQSGNRVSVVIFSNRADIIQPMTYVDSKQTKNEINDKIDAIKNYGETSAGKALNVSMDEINKTYEKSRDAMVIFLSDGEPTDNSAQELTELLEPYNQKNITINTVAMLIKSDSGNNFLKNIAESTEGTFYDISNTNELNGVFRKIYLNSTERTLISSRTGKTENNELYVVLRILFIALLYFSLALGVGLMFDNKYIVKGFSIGGAIAGIIAGIIIEYGCQGNIGSNCTLYYNMIANSMFALVFTVFTIFVPFKQDYIKNHESQKRF